MLAEYRNAGAQIGRWRRLILICVGFGLAAATTLLPEFIKGPGWVAAAVAIGCGALGGLGPPALPHMMTTVNPAAH